LYILLVTTDLTRRGGKEINLFHQVQNLDIDILLVRNFYSSELTSVNTTQNNIQQYHLLEEKVSDECLPVYVDSEHPLFILYTSGSTGKPKGVLHTTAGYLLHAKFSFQELFYPTSEDVYWCTADVGWITGHSYFVYGMLSSGVTGVIFAGTPNYPDYDIFWKIVDKYQISILYTAPTVIRALMREGEKHLSSTSRRSLRLLGSVGESINPEAWNWYYKYVGRQNCPIVDTWWQTETGAVMIAPLANIGNNTFKPGCAMLPFYGVDLKILEDGHADESKEGNLVITRPWPGMIRGVYQQPERFKETYFSKFKNYFYTGDLARCDEDGHYWILGRSDDVINIAGHRLGTAEIENALVGHQSVAEAATIPLPDDIKGQKIFAYVVLKNENDIKENYSEIEKELKLHVKNDIGSIALIKKIIFVNNLPKTRSGKIMRRILRNIALGNANNFGDTSTLIDENMIKYLLQVTHEQAV
jgi:acetyl-CoA synthetase